MEPLTGPAHLFVAVRSEVSVRVDWLLEHLGPRTRPKARLSRGYRRQQSRTAVGRAVPLTCAVSRRVAGGPPTERGACACARLRTVCSTRVFLCIREGGQGGHPEVTCPQNGAVGSALHET